MNFLSMQRSASGLGPWSALLLAMALLLPGVGAAQTDRALQKKQMAEVVNTAKFKKPGPYTTKMSGGNQCGTMPFSPKDQP